MFSKQEMECGTLNETKLNASPNQSKFLKNAVFLQNEPHSRGKLVLYSVVFYSEVPRIV